MRPRSGRQHLKHQQLGDLIVAGVRQQMAAAGNRRGPESSRAARHRAAGGWVRRRQLSAVARLGHGTAAVTATSRRRRLSGQLEQARAAIGRRPGRAAGRLRHAHRAARTKRGRLPVPGHPLGQNSRDQPGLHLLHPPATRYWKDFFAKNMLFLFGQTTDAHHEYSTVIQTRRFFSFPYFRISSFRTGIDCT